MRRLLLVVVWIAVVLLGVWTYPRFLAYLVCLKLKEYGASYRSIDVDRRGRFRVNGFKMKGIYAVALIGDVRHPEEVVLVSPVVNFDEFTPASGRIGVRKVLLHDARFVGGNSLLGRTSGDGAAGIRLERVEGVVDYGRIVVVHIRSGVLRTAIGGWQCKGSVLVRGHKVFLREFALTGRAGKFVLSGSVPTKLGFVDFLSGKGFGTLRGVYRLHLTDEGILLVGRGGILVNFSGRRQRLSLKKVFLRYGDRALSFEGSVSGRRITGRFVDGRLRARLESYTIGEGKQKFTVEDVRIDAAKVGGVWRYRIEGSAFGGKLFLFGSRSWKFRLVEPKRLPFGFGLPEAVASAVRVVEGVWSGGRLKISRAVFGRIVFSGGSVDSLVVRDYPDDPIFVAEGVQFGGVRFDRLTGKLLFKDGVVDVKSDQGLEVRFGAGLVSGAFKGVPLTSLGVDFGGYADGKFWVKGGVASAELFVYGLKVGKLVIDSARLTLVGRDLTRIKAILPSGVEFVGRGKMNEKGFVLEGVLGGFKLSPGGESFSGGLKLAWSRRKYTFSLRMFTKKRTHRLFLEGAGSGEFVELKKVVFDGFRGAGSVKVGGGGVIKLTGSLKDLLGFIGFGDLFELKGKSRVSVVIKGQLLGSKTGRSPVALRLRGTLSAQGVSVRMKGSNRELLKGVNITADICPNKILVRHATGEMGDVKFSFTGEVKRLLHYPVVKGKLRLSNLELDTGSLGVGKGSHLSDIYLDGLNVLLDKGCWVKGKDYRFLVNGVLRFKGFLSSPKISGDLDILSGNLLFLGGSFTITRGTISFDFSNGYKPIIDVDAVSHMYGERVCITVNRDGTTSLRAASNEGLDVKPTAEFLLSFLPYNFFFQSLGRALGFDWFTVGLTKEGKLDINIGKDIAYNLFLFYNYRGGVSSFNTRYLLSPELSFSMNVDSTGDEGLSLEYSLPTD